ncbi:hypothetical protein F2Q69_00048920 [Brassica cretica]|uniref:Uncharacterized protein n=1 Tax=Brassica cretica TaxID=69181 RepID=A0A8S9PLN5_BRACR|nr:hypothetical protein F2Q69_00048920 [Brassica cretica]
MVQSSEVPTKRSSEFLSGISEERSRRKIPRNESLGIFRGMSPSVYSEEHVPRPPVEPPYGSPTKICDHPCPSTEPGRSPERRERSRAEEEERNEEEEAARGYKT